MEKDALQSMTEALNWIINENRMYVTAEEIPELLSRLAKKKAVYKNITVSDNGVEVTAEKAEDLKKEFASLLEALRDVYAKHMGEDEAAQAIKTSLKGDLLEMNEEGVTLPEWVKKQTQTTRPVESMDEDEKIKLVCAIYTEIIQDLITKGKPKITPQEFKKIISEHAIKNPELPPLSISPDGKVLSRDPQIQGSRENRELIIGKYSSLLTKFLNLLESRLGSKEALEIINICHEGLDARHEHLSELGVTKGLFRGVFWTRVPTGVSGLDALTEGGFPKKAAIVIQGRIGSEKSMFGTQFIAEALASDNSALVVLNNTSVDEFRNFLSRFDIDALHYEKERKLCYVDCYSWRTEPVRDFEEKWPVIRVERDLSSMGVGIQRAAKWLAPTPVKRAYLELLSPFLKHFDFDPVYDFTQVLKARLKDEGFTSIFILELGMHDSQVVSSIQEIFDGVIDVKVESEGEEIRRSLVVMHMKDTALRPHYYPINVGEAGVTVEVAEQ